jgi:YidC/Oxa1 family membrane protein insertase
VRFFDAFRDALYVVLESFQHWMQPIMGSQSYWFSIVLLTIAVRIILIPLTVKQVRSTRVMQELQPELKKLQQKYKNDKPKLQEELMKLYKERGFNPLAGCWPLAAQLPFFWALYRVIYSREINGQPNILIGRSFFGVPLDDRWSALAGWGAKLGSVAGLTILGLIIAMACTTYISQKQLMAKQTADINPQQQMLLRIMPLMFVIFAVNVPLAVVLYWVTTNLWSMGQQWILLRNSPATVAATAAGAPAPATAAAAVPTENESPPRRGLGALGLFRGQAQAPADQKEGEGGAGNGSSGQRRAASQGRAGSANQGKNAPADGKGTSTSRRQKTGGNKAGQARSTQAGRSGSGTGRKPGSGGRPTGKGKAGGQRRSKR